MDKHWPAKSNLFCEVDSDSVTEIASILGADGWLTRSSGRGEVHAERDDSELWIDSANPVLVHGLSRDIRTTASLLAASFRSESKRFAIEVYDASGSLIEKIEDRC